MKVPAGVFRCDRTYFHRGRYETFEVRVPGHSRTLFHKGNIEDDLDGCIAIGRRFGFLHGKPAVLESSLGFADFMSWTGRRPFFYLRVVVRPIDDAA